MEPSLVLQISAFLVAQIITAGGVYAAIRADLARLHERATAAKESADQAHHRIDSLLNHPQRGAT